jgi:hypothetical protein
MSFHDANASLASVWDFCFGSFAIPLWVLALRLSRGTNVSVFAYVAKRMVQMRLLGVRPNDVFYMAGIRTGILVLQDVVARVSCISSDTVHYIGICIREICAIVEEICAILLVRE